MSWHTAIRFSVLLATCTALWCAPGHAQGRKPVVHPRMFAVGRDSLLVECALPAEAGRQPAVIVLPDRFGIQDGTRQLLSSLAEKGLRAYAVQLRSTPISLPSGTPTPEYHASDYELVSQVAIDVMNDTACTGRVGLLGFDVGAMLGAECARRMPLFKAAVLFYPDNREAFAPVLADLAEPVLVCIGGRDPKWGHGAVNDMREAYMDKGRRHRVNVYDGASIMFFNPRHENYAKVATVQAWNDLVLFFRSHLASR